MFDIVYEADCAILGVGSEIWSSCTDKDFSFYGVITQGNTLVYPSTIFKKITKKQFIKIALRLSELSKDEIKYEIKKFLCENKNDKLASYCISDWKYEIPLSCEIY
jgi:hypothetical protein